MLVGCEVHWCWSTDGAQQLRAHVTDRGGLVTVPCRRKITVHVVPGAGDAAAGGARSVVIVAVAGITPCGA